MPIERIPLTPALGLELRGVDLSRPLDDATRIEILDAWIEAGVLLFRDAAHSPEEHMRLSEVFGELEPAATKQLNDPNNPYLMTLAHSPGKSGYQQNYVVDGVERAGWLGWHWDQSFMPTIVRGACLRMTHPAQAMGETGFIDAVAAYGRLGEAMQARIEDLEVVYEFNPDFASGQFGFPKDIRAIGGESQVARGDKVYDFPPSVHPLVITQHETGRKVLKLSPMHARYVLGLERGESDALLTELADHLTDRRFAYYHRWSKDDVIVWDNWRVIHSANGVHPDDSRVAQRTTIMGDYQVGRYLDPTLDRERVTARIVD
jgi:taurine dioxygenase